MAPIPVSGFLSDDGQDWFREHDLSRELICGAYKSCLPGALSRLNSGSALPSSPGSMFYYDAIEKLGGDLSFYGWERRLIDGQPRLVHPNKVISITVSGATGLSSPGKTPRTNSKGRATRSSLAYVQPPQSLFDGTEYEPSLETQSWTEVEDHSLYQSIPLWMVLHELTKDGVYLEISRPASMTEGGIVNGWAERQKIGFLPKEPDDTFGPNDGDDFDVPVEPL